MKSDEMKIGKTGKVPAERRPIHIGGKDERWFYVGRKSCGFFGPGPIGMVVEVRIPTRAIQRALCLMGLQLGRQRAMRKMSRKGARQ